MRIRSAAQRRYIQRTLLFSGLYVLSLFVAVFLHSRNMMEGPLAYPLAVLPGLCIAGVFLAIGRLIVEEQDEFIRMLIIRQSLIATGFALSISTVYGFLNSFELAPHIHAYWTTILWFAGLGVGAVANKLQYGAWGECA